MAAATKQSPETDGSNDRTTRNLSRAEVTSKLNTFAKTSNDDKTNKENTHAKKTLKSTNISENVKISGGMTHEKSRKRDSPKKNNSSVKDSNQRANTEEHSNGSTPKEANKQKNEHKNVTRNNGRQRAMSSTDMVVWLADALEGILRSGEDKQHSLSASGRGKLYHCELF